MRHKLSLVGADKRIVRVDLHNHIGTKKKISKYGVERIVAQAYDKLGKGGVLSIANFLGQFRTQDHFHFDNFYDSCGNSGEIDLGNAIRFPEKDILVVKGEEVVVFERTYESHLLFLGALYGTNMTPNTTFEYAIEEGREKELIIGLDHPFARMGLLSRVQDNSKRMRELVEAVDFLEVHNGEMCLPFFGRGTNELTQAFYNNYKEEFPHLGAIISSDGHSLGEIGSSYTHLAMPEDYSCLTDSVEVLRYLGDAVVGNRNPRGDRTLSYGPTVRHAWEILCNVGISGVKAKLGKNN
ncbi:hypothetical protein K8R33_00265 [archaeon]|nr:hypothetical protein [archaeon]